MAAGMTKAELEAEREAHRRRQAKLVEPAIEAAKRRQKAWAEWGSRPSGKKGLKPFRVKG